MDKKDERRLKPELPLMNNEITLEQLQIGPKPEIVEKLVMGRNESAKSFMKADLDRLHGSIKLEQIKPKFQMIDKIPVMNAEKDLRTGNVDVRDTLPKTAKIEDSRSHDLQSRTLNEASLRLPMHPELALTAAMKKLNQRSLR